MSEPMQIPVELPVEAVKQYVMGEQLTPYNFDLLHNYFEGRVIKLLDQVTDELKRRNALVKAHSDILLQIRAEMYTGWELDTEQK